MKMEITDNVSSYLCFKIGEEEFAAHVDDVLSILEVQEITKLPDATSYVKGVINLRGTVLPIIDTRVKFGMSPTVYTDRTCIIVMDIGTINGVFHVGALVDSVESVQEFDMNSILPPPLIGNAFQSELISGMIQTNQNLVMILNLEKLFAKNEITELKRNIN